MRDFDKRFNRTRRFVFTFIGAVFVFIIGYWIVVGVIIGKVASDPENAAEKVGEAARKIKDGWDQGFKVEHSAEDTINIDSLLREDGN